MKIKKFHNKKVVLEKAMLCDIQGKNFIMKTEFGKILVHTSKDFKPEFGKIYKHIPCILYRIEYISNFFSFDYSKYLKSQNVYFSTYINKPENHTNCFSLQRIKNDFFSKFIDFNTTPKEKLLALSMTLGIKNAKKKIYDIFSYYGLNHIIAFSGTHLSIFLMVFSLYKKHNFFTLFIPVFFMFFCFSPSLLRASFIFYMNYLSNRFGREPYVLEWLGFFSIFYILINPFIIWNPSFILSYFFFSQIVLFNKDSVFLILLLSLENLFLNGRLFLLFPFLSTIIIAFMPFLIISGLFWCLTFFKHDILIFGYSVLNNSLQSDILKKIYFISPYSMISFLSIFLFILFFRKKWLYLLFVLYILLYLYITFFPYMLIFDTGHGQSILVNTPEACFLLDAGNKDYFIDKSISAFLSYFSKNIDYVIISHNDSDHYSGAFKLYESGYIKKIFAGKNSSIDKKNIPIKKIDGFYFHSFPYINISGKRFENIGTDNEVSMFYEIDFINKKTLILSDLEANVLDARLSKDSSVINVIIGHHGSADSISSKTLSFWKDPTFFISCNKKFDNPNKKILKLLEKRRLYSTREKGAIFVDLTTGFKLFSGK